jgi:hypothetical protein
MLNVKLKMLNYFIMPKCIVIGMAAKMIGTMMENQRPTDLISGVYFL